MQPALAKIIGKKKKEEEKKKETAIFFHFKIQKML